MIKQRLVICQMSPNFQFSQWDIVEFRKYFSNIVMHYDMVDPEWKQIKKDDILFVYAVGYHPPPVVKCFAKFGMMFPGFALRPFTNLKQREELEKGFKYYTAIFCNDGPVWESYKNIPNMYKVPYGLASNLFKKTRKRDTFKRIILVANNRYPEPSYKGRHIAEEAMKLMPYDWELIPKHDHPYGYIPFLELPDIYQNADGFLSPQMIGAPPDCEVDCTYNGATLEAGMSGCIVFWHDCMKLGNRLETVFEISLDPIEIAARIQDVVKNINLDEHSSKTAEEFHEHCNIENATKCKIEIIKSFL